MTKSAFPFALLVVVLATPAHADTFFTDTARFNAQTSVPAVGPPLNQVSIGGLTGGRVFQNTIDPGGALVLNNRTNAVGAMPIRSATVGGAAGGVELGGPLSAGGQEMIAIFGVQAVVSSPFGGGAIPEITFTQGRLQIVGITPGTFVRDDVTTWGFQSNLNNPAVLATYILKPQENVVPGTVIHPSVDSEPRALDANDTNVSGGNLAVGSILQSIILLEEQPQTSPVPPGSQNLLNSDSTLAGLLNALGFAISNEAILGDIDEEIVTLTQSILDSTEQDILNAIAQFGFLENFADFTAAGPANFTVDLANLPGVADFITNLGGNFIPGLQAQLQVEPEPASLMAWVVVGLVGGALASSRKFVRSMPRNA